MTKKALHWPKFQRRRLSESEVKKKKKPVSQEERTESIQSSEKFITNRRNKTIIVPTYFNFNSTKQ